jgi:hypothetical protein
MDLSFSVEIKSPSVTNFVVSVNRVGIRFSGLGGSDGLGGFGSQLQGSFN